MTGDYERYNFWHSELDQFIADEKKKKEGLPLMTIEEEIVPLPRDTWSTDFYLDGSINRFNNDLFTTINLKND
jgi:hypothetical protein